MTTSLGVAGVMILAAGLTACEPRSLSCPYNDAPTAAPSAGCFVANQTGVLVVEHPGGAVSMPGGAVEPGESARCAAVRETREETGAPVSAGLLLATFESGFELFACERLDESAPLRTRMPEEIQAVYFLPRTHFRETLWRFPSDLPVFEQLYDHERD